MTLPTWHKHISEREADGSWEDCTFDSGLEWYRLTHDRSIPATHAEAQALRDASGKGPTGGSNLGDLRAGIHARYGPWVQTPISGFDSLWVALSEGTAAVVQGSMAAFGKAHRLSRFDPNFDGGHAVCVMRLDGLDRVWWCDPEAPTGTYAGEWVTKDELRMFVATFAGQHMVGKILPEIAEEEPMLKTYSPGTVITLKPKSNVRSSPRMAGKILRSLSAAESWRIIGTVEGDSDPEGGSRVWYIRYSNGSYEYTALSNVTRVYDPVQEFATERAQLQKSISDLRALCDAANAKIANAKVALG